GPAGGESRTSRRRRDSTCGPSSPARCGHNGRRPTRMIAMTWPVTLQTWLAFAGAVLVLNVTPGPDMMFVTATGLARGPKAGVMAALGIGLGSAAHVLLATAGLAALL